MNIQDLSKNLKTEIKPCYLVTGNDLFFKRSAFKQFKKLVAEDAADFNIVYLTTAITAEALFVNLQTPPLMSDYRVIFLKGDGKKLEKDKAKAFEDVVKKWTRDACPNVVLVVDSEEDNFKFLTKYGEVVDCKKQTERYLVDGVLSIITKKGYKIDRESVRTIVSRCNCDMMIISNEITKLTALAEDKNITDDMVQSVVISSIEESVYKLTDKIAQENCAEAYQIMDNLLASREEPFKILATITGQYRRMFICKVSKLSNAELSSQLGVKEYAVEIARRTANSYKPMQLKRVLDKLQLIEYQAKSGKIGIHEGLNLALAFALNRGVV